MTLRIIYKTRYKMGILFIVVVVLWQHSWCVADYVSGNKQSLLLAGFGQKWISFGNIYYYTTTVPYSLDK